LASVRYLDANKLDYFNSQAIANEMFDTGVNMGTSVAALFLQQALNLCNKNQLSYKDVDEDGQISIGGETLTTLNTKAKEKAILNTLNMLQGRKYLSIMEDKKSQEEFWPSWLSRVIIN
jgi:lysozyme family protein